ncbi:MAG TPA: hypothetical protein DDY78_06320 [Planctomycetales bacterium]|nr:hypothetical protein [Planctomycetales bacterium]
MNCHLCGKNCVSRLEGRRTVLSGKVLFLCNACSPDGQLNSERLAVSQSSIAGDASKITDAAATRAA